MVTCSVLGHYKHCERAEERVFQGALLSSRLRYLNKVVSSQIYKKYNWQCVSNELVQLVKRGAGWGQERYGVYYVLHVAGAAKIILLDFNLVVSTPTAKPPNLDPRQISGYTVCGFGHCVQDSHFEHHLCAHGCYHL